MVHPSEATHKDTGQWGLGGLIVSGVWVRRPVQPLRLPRRLPARADRSRRWTMAAPCRLRSRRRTGTRRGPPRRMTRRRRIPDQNGLMMDSVGRDADKRHGGMRLWFGPLVVCRVMPPQYRYLRCGLVPWWFVVCCVVSSWCCRVVVALVVVVVLWWWVVCFCCCCCCWCCCGVGVCGGGWLAGGVCGGVVCLSLLLSSLLCCLLCAYVRSFE